MRNITRRKSYIILRCDVVRIKVIPQFCKDSGSIDSLSQINFWLLYNEEFKMKHDSEAIPSELIESTIFFIRGQRVMLSTHLADLYDVEPRVLVQAVKRNIDRFPDDFMFQLTEQEFENLKSHFVISSWGGLRRATPFGFTEQGVAMLSSVLRSTRAVQVNIEIMRTFVRIRRIITANDDLSRKLDDLEKKYDQQFSVVFEAIRQLMIPSEKERRRIGFLASGPD
jgi:hypothetical protein